MGWFSRKPTPQKQVEAAITVATNLYLHTIPGAEDAPTPLHFTLPDSKYRYLLFCLSAVVTAILAYDEKKDFQPEVLSNGCLQFAIGAATVQTQDYFSVPTTPQDAARNAIAYFTAFAKQWSKWPELENQGKALESIDLICTMLRTTESDEPAGEMDLKRLGELALSIDCKMPTMRAAFIELSKR
jgi:hypothetical protein